MLPPAPLAKPAGEEQKDKGEGPDWPWEVSKGGAGQATEGEGSPPKKEPLHVCQQFTSDNTTTTTTTPRLKWVGAGTHPPLGGIY